MEIFVRDAESETVKWRSVLVNVIVFFTDVTSDTGTSFSLSRRWMWFWDV